MLHQKSLLVGGGAVFGGLFVFVMTRGAPGPSSSPLSTSASAALAGRELDASVRDRRVRARVPHRAQGQQVSVDDREPSPPEDQEDPPDPVGDHALALEAHELEPRDDSWAAEAERVFSRELSSLATLGMFEVMRVDCRMETCVATLRWPSYAVALQRYGVVGGNRFSVECGMQIILPEPSERNETYEASFLFPCKRDGS